MGLPNNQRQKLDEFWEYCLKNQFFNIGYPESADFNYSNLYKFFNFSLNNCGDWQQDSNYILNTFAFEKEVIGYFANLFQISQDECWGYVTNGGTEGNIFGCYLARELFPNATLYLSDNAHYSAFKAIRLLGVKAQIINSLPNGEMDYSDLASKIRKDNEHHPIIFANIGTTVTGAIDNIKEIHSILHTLNISKEDCYIHADAALSGMILPFVDNPQPFRFSDGIDSICISGHKMIGMPMPCGIVLTKKHFVNQVKTSVEYIATDDQSIGGSRNGHSVLFLWDAIHRYSHNQWCERINHCLQLSDYIIEKFQSFDIDAWKNPNSITVVFPKPSDYIWKKHHLAVSGCWAHLIALPHHHKNQLDDVIFDIACDLNKNRWLYQEG
ncbi:histidine decarboxylase [Moraxella marmotae]|uniref:histidine decarboxylase n=1 Tax=Moraxella marmotae TaxID=3344520 RepID=UPI0035F4B9AD